MEIETLNALHSLAGTLTFREGPGGLPIALITTPDATAAISPYGAHLLSCTLGSQELLFLSQKAIFNQGTPIRGGVPICWPWFGPDPQQRGRSDHGLARTRMWNVVSSALIPDGGCILTLELTDTPETYALWPHRFRLTLTLTVGKTLSMELTTHNLGDIPMELTQALHTYFAVGDISQTVITGLEGYTYADKTDGGTEKIQSGPLCIDAETDRIYPFDGGDIIIHDESLKRTIRITCEGSKTAVVWNPWSRVCEEKNDLSADDYKKMVCIETANTGDEIITLLPAKSHRLRALYVVER
ncbi:MAG: D-hexose-6-phosphate mutarotase [Sulfuricurvum sp.]|jgi:glucose-6-phosphate 1-epimerase|uniref:D-hexose-6-phosphate mutarotase n=1 Tax=Sulfuricurvum sp. TaxID=2025608 RepID=UPI0025FD550C|nr:D-hexose-6-phosphate mutarotase [Sulfuricurvum sp.]MCK9373802.1 D-hexose-6-phosphate mutarotase [Sulfuricurvum sp.]